MKIVTAAPHTPEFTRKSEGDVVELRDGRLLLSYMEFSGDGSDIAPTRIVAVESADGGNTWGHHRVLTATRPGELNVFSPSLIHAADGGILFLFMRQMSHTPLVITQYVWKSDDEGKTFKPLAEFAVGKDFSLCNAVVKRLASGRLLLPTSPVVKLGSHAYGHTYSAAVLYSDDDGVTWRESNRVHLPMRGVMEPHVEETRDGRVLMVVRSQLGSLFLSESSDGGATWSLLQTSGLRVPESCPELVRIPQTGDLLMIWNNSPYDPAFSHYGKRSPLTAAVSRDEGRTWQHVRDIESDPARAFSNPGCRFTRDGRAIVNYWTCEYLPDWNMQDVIDLRVAIIDTAWFYGGH
jgi:sialidase-1